MCRQYSDGVNSRKVVPDIADPTCNVGFLCLLGLIIITPAGLLWLHPVTVMFLLVVKLLERHGHRHSTQDSSDFVGIVKPTLGR